MQMFLLLFLQFIYLSNGDFGSPFGMISKLQTECEVEALSIGSALADHYNSYDEETEWDARIHHDYLVEHLGFAGWIQQGTWGSKGLTAERKSASALHQRGGWAGRKNISASAFWALENQWLYMMGDSTERQIWATYVSPFQNNEFERNAKEWTRENCARQFPHRKEHPAGGYFPEEGWGGKCGNNEVTCDLSGFGPLGKITFDWKHFPWEDYDQWLFGEDGKWSNKTETRRPDILTFQLGLHTCFHAFAGAAVNDTLIKQHEGDLPKLMRAVREAIDRPHNNDKNNSAGSAARTIVIVSTAGRVGNPDHNLDKCSWRFNRVAAKAAHQQGFVVFEREEIERRLLYKSEHYHDHRTIKMALHMDAPAPQIVGTSLLALISCLKRNGTLPLLRRY